MREIFKFGILSGESNVEFMYKNSWCVERNDNFQRVMVAPKDNQIDFMLEILKNFEPPFWCLYVLLFSRAGNETARYVQPTKMSFKEICKFVSKFKEFFETDGRHNLWLSSAKTGQLEVYDNHNVIYIYDDVVRTSKFIKKKFASVEEKIIFPVPHTHWFNVENDEIEMDIINYWKWIKSPLI